MSKLIEALEMELGDDEEDDGDHYTSATRESKSFLRTTGGPNHHHRQYPPPRKMGAIGNGNGSHVIRKGSSFNNSSSNNNNNNNNGPSFTMISSIQTRIRLGNCSGTSSSNNNNNNGSSMFRKLFVLLLVLASFMGLVVLYGVWDGPEEEQILLDSSDTNVYKDTVPVSSILSSSSTTTTTSSELDGGVITPPTTNDESSSSGIMIPNDEQKVVTTSTEKTDPDPTDIVEVPVLVVVVEGDEKQDNSGVPPSESSAHVLTITTTTTSDLDNVVVDDSDGVDASSSSSGGENNEGSGTTTDLADSHHSDGDTTSVDGESIPPPATSSATDSTNPDAIVVDETTPTTTTTESDSNEVQPSTDTTIETTTTRNRGYLYSQIATVIPDPDHDVVDETTKVEIQEKYGKWRFWDGDEMNRPTFDYCGQYPNRDIPGQEFPENSWQSDAVFVNHIVDDAEKLIARAKEAIFTEYGHGKPLRPEQLSERLKMFHVELLNDDDGGMIQPEKYKKRGDRGDGGWSTKRSWEGLVKRILHAIMTNDTFTIVMAGHSAAAGHGNHFHQSYLMQLHKILAPVFARLGVKLITHNFSQGGLGTLHNAMGMQQLYGNEIDMIMWDSGMTEPDSTHVDLFMRQALLSGNRIPFIYGGKWDVLKYLHDVVDADVGEYGNGMDGIEEIHNTTHALSIPYAARYLKCTKEAEEICKSVSPFCAHCWLDRSDMNVKEHFNNIDEKPSGQVKWHPGWRKHQLQGRVLAFTMLDALQDAIQIISDGTMGGPPLDEAWWHVTDYYNNIRTKMQTLATSTSGGGGGGECPKIASHLPIRICSIPLQARSFYTPRYQPFETSISTILKPSTLIEITNNNNNNDPTTTTTTTTPSLYVPKNLEKMEYTGYDIHNQCYDIPINQTDVVTIISGRRRRLQLYEMDDHNSTNMMTDDDEYDTAEYDEDDQQPSPPIITLDGELERHPYYAIAERSSSSNKQQEQPQLQQLTAISTTLDRQLEQQQDDETIIPGLGWVVVEEPPGQCDGTYDAICGRARWESCPLIGHHDHRGVVIGDEYAGWLVFVLPNVQHGMILLKIVTYLTEKYNWKTKYWTSVNNQGNQNQNDGVDVPTLRQRQLVDSNQLFNNMTSIIVTNDSSPSTTLVRRRRQQQQQQQRRRMVDQGPELYPDTFVFEYAINGVITSLKKDEFIQFIRKPQRVMEMLTLLDDNQYVPTNEPVEVAIRMKHCGRDCPIAVSHIYWA